MAVLIDTSILIEHERGRLDLERHLLPRREEAFFLSVVTASELLHGVHQRRGIGRASEAFSLCRSAVGTFSFIANRPGDRPVARASVGRVGRGGQRRWAE